MFKTNVALKWVRVIQLSTSVRLSDFDDNFVGECLPLDLVEAEVFHAVNDHEMYWQERTGFNRCDFFLKGVFICDHENFSEKRTLNEIWSAEITFPFEMLIARKRKLGLPDTYSGKAIVAFSRARRGVLCWALKSVCIEL